MNLPSSPIKFEVILPVSTKDINQLPVTIQYICKNIASEEIIVISNKSNKTFALENGADRFIDEDMLINKLTLERVKHLLCENGGTPLRSGWYFQQFLKMAYAYVCNNEYYLIWDSDTIPLRKITFFDTSMKCLITMKTEFHVPYFKTIKKLFSGEIIKLTNKSFIAEHMIIKKQYMINMLEKIENNGDLKGEFFYEKIINAIDKIDINGAGFSEFETYGNFILAHYPDTFITRELSMLRDGTNFLEKNMINEKILEWISKKYDAISFEEHFYDVLSIKIRSLLKFIVLFRIVPFNIYQYIFKIVYKTFKAIFS